MVFSSHVSPLAVHPFRRCTSAIEMPCTFIVEMLHTMGGMDHTGGDARADEASKPRIKLDLDKPIAVGEGSRGQQVRLDILVKGSRRGV